MVYERCTIAFLDNAGQLLETEWVEMTADQLADASFVAIVQADQMHRAPQHTTSAVLLHGQLSTAACAAALATNR